MVSTRWQRNDGRNWNHSFAKSLAVYLNGYGIHSPSEHGERIIDDTFYIIFNAHYGTIQYKLPAKKYGKQWTKILDTSTPDMTEGPVYQPEEIIDVKSRSVVLLKYPRMAQA